jgi:hypothetical protein
MTLYTLVQEFQSLIVGTLGFAGVIITLVLNARYAREQRREERSHECQTLRVALIEELSINRMSLARNIEEIKNVPDVGAALTCPPIPWTMPIGHSPTGLAC